MTTHPTAKSETTAPSTSPAGQSPSPPNAWNAPYSMSKNGQRSNQTCRNSRPAATTTWDMDMFLTAQSMNSAYHPTEVDLSALDEASDTDFQEVLWKILQDLETEHHFACAIITGKGAHQSAPAATIVIQHIFTLARHPDWMGLSILLPYLRGQPRPHMGVPTSTPISPRTMIAVPDVMMPEQVSQPLTPPPEGRTPSPRRHRRLARRRILPLVPRRTPDLGPVDIQQQESHEEQHGVNHPPAPAGLHRVDVRGSGPLDQPTPRLRGFTLDRFKESVRSPVHPAQVGNRPYIRGLASPCRNQPTQTTTPRPGKNSPDRRQEKAPPAHTRRGSAKREEAEAPSQARLGLVDTKKQKRAEYERQQNQTPERKERNAALNPERKQPATSLIPSFQ